MVVRLGADGAVDVGLVHYDECCPPPLCGADLCAMFCSFINLLPQGPMWDYWKRKAIERYSRDPLDPDICAELFIDPEPCPSVVQHAIYTVWRLRDLVHQGLYPALRESDPTTAETTLDAWIERLKWEDCYLQQCRSVIHGELTPYEIMGECGPIFCPPNINDDLACAVKRGIIIALTRANMGIIKNLDGINWVIEPLGAVMKPRNPPECEPSECQPCNENCPDCLEFDVVGIGETIEGCLTVGPCDAHPVRPQIPTLINYGCDAPAGLPSCIYPNVIAAECIVRSMIWKTCPNIINPVKIPPIDPTPPIPPDPPDPPSDVFTEEEIAFHNEWAENQSADIVANGNPNLQQFDPGNGHVVYYGQSLNEGVRSQWLRREAAMHDAKMIGDAIWPAGIEPVTFVPYGTNILKDYVPRVKSPYTGLLVLSDTAPDATWNAGLYGSDHPTGWSDSAKQNWLDLNSVISDPTRRFTLTSTGSGGRSVLELSKGGIYYARTVDGANLIKGHSDVEGNDSYTAAIDITQGEADSSEGTSETVYFNRMDTLLNDLDTDISAGIYGKAKRPLKILHQTSARWSLDDTRLAVQMAQLRLAEERNDTVVAGPTYIYTCKSDGHLDANGHLWKGLQGGKVYTRCVTYGEGWQPTKMLKALWRKKEILLLYHTPVAPLIFKSVAVGFTVTNFTNKGYKVLVSDVEVAIEAVEIVDSQTIRIRLEDIPLSAPEIWYASESTSGRGNVTDSDPTVAMYKYTYLPSKGDAAECNVAAYVNLPFPLNNAAAVQTITAQAA